MDFVMAEFGRVHAEREEKEPGEMAAKAAQMADDYLEREKRERHSVPFATRHLLHLLAEGLHLYPEDLGTLGEYVRSRQDQLQGDWTRATVQSGPGGGFLLRFLTWTRKVGGSIPGAAMMRSAQLLGP